MPRSLGFSLAEGEAYLRLKGKTRVKGNDTLQLLRGTQELQHKQMTNSNRCELDTFQKFPLPALIGIRHFVMKIPRWEGGTFKPLISHFPTGTPYTRD